MSEQQSYETGSLEPIPGRCGGKLRGRDRYCMQYPLRGRKACRLHNGRAPQGQASVHFKDGRHSRVLPVRVASRYEKLRVDPEILTLNNEIAVADLMMQELLENVYRDDQEAVESGTLWHRLKNLRLAFMRARDSGDAAKAAACVTAAWDLIDQGASRQEARAEMLTVMDSRRKLVDSEQKRLRDEQYNMPIEQFLQFVGMLTNVINTVFDDAAGKREFVHRLHGLIGGREIPGAVIDQGEE